MSDFDILKPGPWFGCRADFDSNSFLPPLSDEHARLEYLAMAMKSGRFEYREKLREFIVDCSDNEIRRQSIRLYSYSSGHADVEFLGDLISKFDGDELFTIIISSKGVLSYEILPYLVVLLDEYEGTSLEMPILTSLNIVSGLDYDGDGLDRDLLVECLSKIVSNSNKKLYYYNGNPVFIGDWTKQLVESAILSRNNCSPFPLADIPIYISMFSGLKCPLFYGDNVDDAAMGEIFSYVRKVASMSWEKGKKYFYGNVITS